MFQFINKLITDNLGEGFFQTCLIDLAFILAICCLSFIVFLVLASINSGIRKKTSRLLIKTGSESISKHKLTRHVSVFSMFVMMAAFSGNGFNSSSAFFAKLGVIGTLCMLMVIVGRVLDVVIDLYATREISKTKPIKGPVQVVKILIYIVLSLILIAVLINQNPIVLISGIGAFTAILSIVFKDALLGLVAGVQITSENLLRIGDWISIPSMGVEGAVTDIQLISVKIKAYDNNAITIPAYTFLSVPFKNHNASINKNARQLSRTIYVNSDDVKLKGDVTNLTMYRKALEQTLRDNPHVKEDYSLVVKTGSSVNGYGIPVEIYATVDIADYDKYCDFCSTIEEMSIALLNEHGLRFYQAKT